MYDYGTFTFESKAEVLDKGEDVLESRQDTVLD